MTHAQNSRGLWPFMVNGNLLRDSLQFSASPAQGIGLYGDGLRNVRIRDHPMDETREVQATGALEQDHVPGTQLVDLLPALHNLPPPKVRQNRCIYIPSQKYAFQPLTRGSIGERVNQQALVPQQALLHSIASGGGTGDRSDRGCRSQPSLSARRHGQIVWPWPTVTCLSGHFDIWKAPLPGYCPLRCRSRQERRRGHGRRGHGGQEGFPCRKSHSAWISPSP
jgi:hypothetical protein